MFTARGIPDDLREEFDQLVRAAGSDRSAEIRRLMEWCVGRPDAQPPRQLGGSPSKVVDSHPGPPVVPEVGSHPAEPPLSEVDSRPEPASADAVDSHLAVEDELIAAEFAYGPLRLSKAAAATLYRLRVVRARHDRGDAVDALLADARSDARALAGRRLRIDGDEAGIRLKAALRAYGHATSN